MDIQKVAFVTGGGTGIGKGIALTLAKKGYDVAISCRESLKGAEAAASEIRALGRRAEIFSADLSKVDEILRMFRDFREKFDRLDLFCNNAGLTEKMPFLETTEENFDRVTGVDFKGAFFCVKEAAKFMVEKGIQGSIVIISSNNAEAHYANSAVYGPVKAAVSKFGEHAALELARYHIRVNTIEPGYTDTGSPRMGSKDDTYYKIPLGKWTTVEEVAEAVAYLGSPFASSITGATLVMDNGALLVSDKRELYGF